MGKKAAISIVTLFFALSGLLIYTSDYLYWREKLATNPTSEKIVGRQAPLFPANKPLSVLSWNIQFLAGGKNNHFADDHGHDPWPSRQTIQEVAEKIAHKITEVDPDFVALQEVDFGSALTHYTEEAKLLSGLLPQYKQMVCTPIWKARFSPEPSVLGKVNFGQCIFSKYQMQDAKRYALPSDVGYSWIYHQFYLKRAILSVTIPMSNHQQFTLLNTHLSAYGGKVNATLHQVRFIKELIQKLERQSLPTIIGGDFNSLVSPTLREEVVEQDRYMYATDNSPMLGLFETFQAYPTLENATGENRKHFYTYIPPYENRQIPDRTIDFFFFSQSFLKMQQARVLNTGTIDLSDHFPIHIQLSLISSPA